MIITNFYTALNQVRMKTILLFLLIITPSIIFSQIDENSVMGIPQATTAEIIAVTTAPAGSMAYSSDENKLYHFNGTTWIVLGPDSN